MNMVRAIEVAEKLILMAMRIVRAAGSATQPDGNPSRIPEDHEMSNLLMHAGLTPEEVKEIVGR